MGQVRRGVVALVFLVALAPLTAYADQPDGNQAAIDKVKAEQQWLTSLPVLDKGVAMGQREIANARAIAKLLSFNGNAQMEIPNSMEMYRAFCAQAIVKLDAGLSNAQAMSAAQPWNPHLLAEVSNADAKVHFLWDMIGATYPGNPYALPATPAGPGFTADAPTDDDAVAVDDEATADALVAEGDAIEPAIADDGAN